MVYIAIAPPEILETNLIEKVADIIGKDLYETRLLLAGKTPRVVAHYDDAHMAELADQKLRALGVVAVMCQDAELRKLPQPYKARILELEERAVLFRDRKGQAKRMEAKDVFLILKGKMQTYTEKEVTTTRIKFSWPATVLTGGIPIWRRVKEKTKDRSVRDEFFVRLYDRVSYEPIVEFLEYELDYSFLGEKMAYSSVTNLDITITELRNRFPQATFDARLIEPLGIDIPLTTPRENIEINCKLIYLYHRAVSDPGSSVSS